MCHAWQYILTFDLYTITQKTMCNLSYTCHALVVYQSPPLVTWYVGWLPTRIMLAAQNQESTMISGMNSMTLLT